MIQEQIISPVVDAISSIGEDVIQKKIKSHFDQKKIQDRLNEYLKRELQKNNVCTKEEEIDFEGLANYIREELVDEAATYFLGNTCDRRNARNDILQKAVIYAQAKTNLSRKRAQKIISNALKILKSFFRKSVPKEMLFVAQEIIDETQKCISENTGEIKELHAQLENRLTEKFDESSLLSVENNLKLLQNSRIDQVERNITTALHAIQHEHELNPYYRYEVVPVEGKYRLISVPNRPDAYRLYPPQMHAKGTASMGGKVISHITPDTLNFSNRHQIPIELNITEAVKHLGDFPDPSQVEAEQAIGKKYLIMPKPFPPAFSCSLMCDDHTVVEYLLLRTKEILDDGTFILTNDEQANPDFKVELRIHIKNRTGRYSFSSKGLGNKSNLRIHYLIKDIISSSVIKLHALEHGVDFATWNSPSDPYKPMLETLDDDIKFYEDIVLIEKYFNTAIRIPKSISENDLAHISYISQIIRGEICESKWSSLSTELIITEQLQSISELEKAEFSLQVFGKVEVELWEHNLPLSICRTFLHVKPTDPDKMKAKIHVLDIGDPLKISLVPGSTDDIFQDRLDTQHGTA